MTDDTTSLHSQAQRRYEDRQREAGLRRKSVWVPEAVESDFWDAIERMRRDWRARGLLPVGD